MSHTTGNPRLDEKHTVELTAAEIYVIRASLEQFSDIRDSEYRTMADIASTLWGQFPHIDVAWKDLAS